jgi:small subunit ribosomal protein S7e
MSTNKIVKPIGVSPDDLELQVAQNIQELENNVPELKTELRALQFSAAKQVRDEQFSFFENRF